MSRFIFSLILLATMVACQSTDTKPTDSQTMEPPSFVIKKEGEKLQIFQKDGDQALVTQNAEANHRPYLHPILAPNSTAELTQFSPGHHKHQTGLYWGFTRVNGTGIDDEGLRKWFYDKDKPDDIKEQIGRDYFHHPQDGYWEKVSADILIPEGEKVKWQTVYHMLDANGTPILKENQVWTFEKKANKHHLELEWKGEALVDITINAFEYGGLFLRMPWQEGIEGEAVNAARQRNEKAEGQRAMWVDVGMEIEGLNEWGHITIFDHPDNDGFPQAWRVDGQLGVGPVRARMGDWQILKGETTTFQHGIVAYTGRLNDIEMKQLWSDYVGDHGMYNAASLWDIAQEEGRAARFLSPNEAVEHMSIQPGYQVNAFAAEPMITQPMAFCWDDKGRMWIAENRDYESRESGFSNSGDSRILILEDTDRDGVADKQIVFLEDIPFPSAIAVGFDGLFLGAPPNLLFVPDKNSDDKADIEDIKVLLTGWGIRDRHETINSFHWGPDGWLYGLEGFATPSKIRKPVGEGRIYRAGEAFPADLLEAEGIDINGGVWRYHPIKNRFEVVAHGFSNPWGIDYNAKGQLFITACVIPHLFHIVQGGIYQRQGGRHFNPYVYEDIQTIVDHRHRSAHGGARFYLSDAFPSEQAGRLFMANIHEHAVLSDILSPNGSSFTASHGADFMLANNAQWIGFSMELGPEGGLYVLDWHDADICGKEVLNKETGRVFRIMPERSEAVNFPGRYDDLGSLTDLQLANLQLNKSSWHTRRARLILQNRANQKGLSEEAVSRLEEILSKEADEDIRLRALWAKHICQLTSIKQLLNLLDDKQPHIRAWAIQFLVEDNNPSEQVVSKLIKMAKKETSPTVRLQLAAAIQRMNHKYRLDLAQPLTQHEIDSNDPIIPLMIWFGIEPIVEQELEPALKLAKNSRIPSISSKIARRLVDADLLEPFTQALASTSDRRTEMLKGFLAGLQGRSDLEEPEGWSKTFQVLQKDKKLAPIALEIAQQFGNAAVAKQFLVELKNEKVGTEQRLKALKGLTSQQREELIGVLPRLLDQPELRLEAIRSIAAFEEESLGQLLLKKYPRFNLREQQEAIQSLASRHTYGWQLANAIKEKQIAKRDIPPYIALQLRRVVGNGFVEIWGPIDQLSSNKQSDYAKYQRLLSEAAVQAADPKKGKAVYQRVCWACHKMYDEGGILGPDLTGSNRTNIAYLLSNIIDPSGEIQDDYKMVVITTQDGRTYSGNIIGENDRQLTMRIVGQDELILNKSDIQSKELTPKSMMPEGLLDNLTDEEILDLVAYLRSADQVLGD